MLRARVAVYAAAVSGRPWAGYVRVSRVGTRAGESFRSPTDQTAEIQAWASRRGEHVEMLPPELDASGGTMSRPVLEQALAGIEAGRYRGLVVAYLSRASRNARHLLEMWDRIQVAGGELHSVSEGIDTSTPAGRLTRTMLAAIAEHQLDTYRESFAAQRASATARGIWQRRQTPLGYRRDPATRRLVPDRDADRVRQAFRERAAGATVTDLARGLRMTESGVRHLLRNRVYLGELRVGEHVNPAAHPPLVTVEDWQAAQHASVPRPPRSGRPVLLSGLVRCASCGHVMSPTNTATRHASYTCRGSSSAGPCPRPAAVALERLDSHVERVALPELSRLVVVRDDDGALADAQRALAAAGAELAAYLTGVAAAGIDPADFADGARTRRQAVERAQGLTDRLAAAQGPSPDLAPPAAWPRLSIPQRAHVLRGLLEAVIVRPVGRGKRCPIDDRVRVVVAGTGLISPYRGGGAARGIRPMWPDTDAPGVLRVHDG